MARVLFILWILLVAVGFIVPKFVLTELNEGKWILWYETYWFWLLIISLWGVIWVVHTRRKK